MLGKKQRQAISSVSDWVDQGCCHDLERGMSEVSAVCSLLEMYNTVVLYVPARLSRPGQCVGVHYPPPPRWWQTGSEVRGHSQWVTPARLAGLCCYSSPEIPEGIQQTQTRTLLWLTRQTHSKGEKNNSSNNMKVHCRVGRWGCAPYHWRLHHRTEWSRRSHRTRGTRKVLAWERKWRTSWSLQPALDLWSSPRQHK